MSAEPRHVAISPLPAPGHAGPTAVPTPVSLPAPTRAQRTRSIALRVVTVVAALWLFLVAIAVMKTGARELAPALEGSTLTNSSTSTLGFGWLGAMLVMSGSPIAASALALFDGAALTANQALAMLTGSRLGASFVVLVVALIYALRGKGGSTSRRAALSIGIFSMVLTAIVYVPALAIGLPLLSSGATAPVANLAPFELMSVVDSATGPAVGLITDVAPQTVLFLVGLVLLLTSVRLIDRCLPEAASQTEHLEEHADWRSRAWVMFGVGSLVALVTMSVSVALTVLVPAVAKGYFRRRHAIPYIMGANIATLGDTLVTSLALGNPVAVQIVVVELISTLLVTALLLGFLYRPLTEALVRFTDATLASRRRLIGFCCTLFVVPAILVLLF